MLKHVVRRVVAFGFAVLFLMGISLTSTRAAQAMNLTAFQPTGAVLLAEVAAAPEVETAVEKTDDAETLAAEEDAKEQAEEEAKEAAKAEKKKAKEAAKAEKKKAKEAAKAEKKKAKELEKAEKKKAKEAAKATAVTEDE